MKTEKNVVISVFVTNMEDNLYHEDTSQVDVAQKVERQNQTLARYHVPQYVLTNEPGRKVSENLQIVHVDLFQHYPKLYLWFYRIILTFDFLQAHPEIEKVALTDCKDVEMLNYPFDEVEDGILYMGDETGFIRDNSLVVRNYGPQYMDDFIYENGSLPILNLGLMIGTRAVLIEFLGIMVKLITEEEFKMFNGNSDTGMGYYDMEIGNYVAYRYFRDRLVHGCQVNTVFHGEQQISSAWFKHK